MEPETQPPTARPVNSEITPVSPSPKTNWATSFLFLILGILIGAGGLWGYQNYVVQKPAPPSFASPTPTAEANSPTPDVTANWKTYTNNKYGYLIKYPSSPTTVAYGCKDIYGKEGEEYFYIETNVQNPSIQAVCIIVSVNPTWMLFIQNKGYKNTLGEDYSVEKQSSIPVGTYQATRYYYKKKPTEGFDERWPNVSHTIVKHPHKDIVVVFELNTPEQEQFFDQILSTFQFTN